MNIICFLTVRPTKLFYDFIKQIKSHKIFICIDDNTYDIPDYDNCIEIVKINNDQDEHRYRLFFCIMYTVFSI